MELMGFFTIVIIFLFSGTKLVHASRTHESIWAGELAAIALCIISLRGE